MISLSHSNEKTRLVAWGLEESLMLDTTSERSLLTELRLGFTSSLQFDVSRTSEDSLG